LVRNLTVAEIVDQVMYLARLPAAAESKITNVVFMGMGEPFLNYARVMRSIEQLRSSDGFGLGARRITVSTVGIVPNIERFAREPGEVNLAVSLHAPNDEVRSRLVPYNSRYPVAAIIDATREYAETTKRRVSFEYVLLEGSNDAPHLADELGKLLRPFGALAHVNLIPWNPFPEGGFVRATREQAEAFALRARRAGVNTTIRYSKGLDIDAACGQLRRRQELGLAS
jgi:23S rRNA (adenine2503-C2)-methyltransferase